MTKAFKNPIDPKAALVRGASWAIFMRWSIRALGFLNTVILARILNPADYGIVAMAMLVVFMVEVLVDFGADTNILREQNPTKALIDSAWSLRIIQGVFVAAILVVAAPAAGIFFDEQRIVAIIWVIAVCILISSLGNVGITLARKDLDFRLEFRYHVITKLLGVAVTLIAALSLRDYKALVIGLAAGYVGGCVLSYMLHPYRPSWNTSHLKAMWSFSKWLLLSGIGNFATRKTDELIVGRIANAHDLGIYGIGSEIGQLPTAELGPPMTRALLPTLSAFRDDAARVKSVVLKTLGALNTFTLAAAVGLSSVSEPLTLVLLGNKWSEAAPFIALFAIVGAIKVAVGPLPSLLVLLGMSRLHAKIMWIEFSTFAIAATIFVPEYGVLGLVYARLVSATANFISYFLLSRSHANISLKEFASVLWRPFVGVILMAMAIASIGVDDFPIWIVLTIKIGVGIVTYSSWIVLSWIACGRGDGLERLVFHSIERILKKALLNATTAGLKTWQLLQVLSD